MRKIWKFTLDVVESQVIEMPIDPVIIGPVRPKIRSDGKIVFYAACYPDDDVLLARRFKMFKTGELIPAEDFSTGHFIGTARNRKGVAFHVFHFGADEAAGE